MGNVFWARAENTRAEETFRRAERILFLAHDGQESDSASRLRHGSAQCQLERNAPLDGTQQ